jgi:predicted dehydrogenase
MSRAISAKNLVNNTNKNKHYKAYQDFRELLKDKSIDAVQISTPDHRHVPVSIMAALKGKPICCEKPTLTINEGRLLCDVINNASVVYQVSIEDRLVSIYHKMAEAVLNGHTGKLKHIGISLPGVKLAKENLEVTNPPQVLDFDLWLGSAPAIPFIYSRTFFNFRWNDAFSGGILTDWGDHYCNTAQLASGNEFSGSTEITPAGETLFIMTASSILPISFNYNTNMQTM